MPPAVVGGVAPLHELELLERIEEPDQGGPLDPDLRREVALKLPAQIGQIQQDHRLGVGQADRLQTLIHARLIAARQPHDLEAEFPWGVRGSGGRLHTGSIPS